MDAIDLKYLNQMILNDGTTKQISAEFCDTDLTAALKTKIVNLTPICFNLLKEKYGKNTALVVDKSNLIIVGQKQALLVKKDDGKINVIGGDKTKISKINGILVSQIKPLVVVSDDNKSILLFDYRASGNLVPLLIIKLDSIVNVSQIELNETDHKVIIKNSRGDILKEGSFSDLVSTDLFIPSK